MQPVLLKLLDDVRGSWRFRRVAIVVAWAICFVGWAAILAIPNEYEASARVYLDSQGALRPLLAGLAIEPDIESELNVVRQAMMSGPRLESVAHDAGMDLSGISPKAREAVLASFKDRISVTRDSGEKAVDGVYRIAYRSNNRPQSLAVVKSLLNSLVEGTLGNKRNGQEDARRFLVDQVHGYEQRLSDAESRLAEFKKQNVGEMPSDNGDYFKELQTEMVALTDVGTNLSMAEARHDELEKQITGEEPYIFGFDSANASSAALPSAGGDVAMRIQQLEKKREELLLRFTPKHPEVIAVDNLLAELKARQDAELARIHGGEKATGDLSSSLKVNPIFQSLQVQEKQAAVQVAELRRDYSLRASRVAELKQKVNSVPEVEAQLAKMNRDYDVTRAEYQELLKRLETAELSDKADKTGTVKFQIIEAPTVPQTPVAPRRGILLTGVLFVGLGVGCSIAYLLNMLRPVYFSWKTLAEGIGVPVIGCAYRFDSDTERAANYSQLVKMGVAAASLVLVFAVVIFWSDQGSLLIGLIKHGRMGGR